MNLSEQQEGIITLNRLIAETVSPLLSALWGLLLLGAHNQIYMFQMQGKYQLKIQQPWTGYSFAGPSILQLESHISNILIKSLHTLY